MLATPETCHPADTMSREGVPRLLPVLDIARVPAEHPLELIPA